MGTIQALAGEADLQPKVLKLLPGGTVLRDRAYRLFFP